MATANRLEQFGETVFATWSRLAVEHNAINLGQGFPDFDAPEFVKEAAIQAIRDGENQYSRSAGHPLLVEAIADTFELPTNAMDEVTVTCGSTETIAAVILGVINQGDEVIVIEPFYDSYLACLSMAGAIPKIVTLHSPEFTFNEQELRDAFSDKTKMIIVNSPHNPTGRVFTNTELQLISELAIKHDALVLSDEVYDKLVLTGTHIPMATLPNMKQRTITLRSLGKVFSVTGWKIGWSVAPSKYTVAIRSAHQFMTFCAATPLQVAAATALRAPDSYFLEYTAQYTKRRDLLVEGLRDVGFNVLSPEGTYFVLADHTPFGFSDDISFCHHLVKICGVVGIPPSAFYSRSNEGKGLVRFAFCKGLDTLNNAVERLQGLC
ncbi:MAG: aminotransferase class I/II-fold pyridoxal phosphate-dependent enzyme [Phycisphaerae bacterium]|jgi:L-glutamine---4-(methylsulfanyl)-2-oxobutanoate aminotransferase|nr:aminotransferase class I/II-fold pyridoxal phosphate-dependent enzyme [Phycisphaerae bacterium]